MAKQIWEPKYDSAKAKAALTRVGQAVTLASGEREVEAVNATGDLVHGFVRVAAAKAGDTVEIFREGGEAIGYAGGAITKGAYLKVTADGSLIVTSTSDDLVVGYALEAATDNSEFRLMFSRTKI